jgi:hypothetical protein
MTKGDGSGNIWLCNVTPEDSYADRLPNLILDRGGAVAYMHRQQRNICCMDTV